MKKNEKWNVNVNELIYQRIEGICQRGAALIPYTVVITVISLLLLTVLYSVSTVNF